MTLKTAFLFAAAGFVLAAGAAQAQTAAAGDAARGQTVFKQRCGVCHVGAPGDGAGKIGPALAGVVGRKAGAVQGFRYSKGMTGSDKVWTAAVLDAYLAAPTREVPGTTMVLALPAPKDRADVIAYLVRTSGGK